MNSLQRSMYTFIWKVKKEEEKKTTSRETVDKYFALLHNKSVAK